MRTVMAEAGGWGPGAGRATAVGVLALALTGCLFTERVDVAADGRAGNRAAIEPDLSGDGRFVAFTSEATNLVAGDTNGRSDVFVRDAATGEVRRASLESDGTQLDTSPARGGSISRDGRYVSFATEERATPDDTDSGEDVFVRDLVDGTTTRASVLPPGSPEPIVTRGRLSPNGRFLVAMGIVDPSTGVTLVRDLATGTTRSVTTGIVLKAEVSDDGNVVALLRVLPGGTGLEARYEVRDVEAGTTTIVETVTHHATAWLDCCLSLDLTPDGRHLVHSVADGSRTGLEVFDRESGESRRLPSDPTPNEGSPGFLYVDRLGSISDDGRFVAYERSVVNQHDEARGAYVVHDAATGDLSEVHTLPEGYFSSANLPSAALSGDGRYVAFASTEPGLVAGDADDLSSVFVRFARHPRLSTASPATVARGTTTTVTFTGEWLLEDPVLTVDGEGVTISGVEEVGPREVRATISVAPDAPATRRMVTVTLDGSWPGRAVDGATGRCGCLRVVA